MAGCGAQVNIYSTGGAAEGFCGGDNTAGYRAGKRQYEPVAVADTPKDILRRVGDGRETRPVKPNACAIESEPVAGVNVGIRYIEPDGVAKGGIIAVSPVVIFDGYAEHAQCCNEIQC